MLDNFKKFKDYILKYQLGSTLDKVSFKCLTSLKIGGTCEILYIPDDIESLSFGIKYLINLKIPYFIIGAGTNLLVNDRDFKLVVISLKKIKRFYIQKEEKDDVYIYAEAGVRAPILSEYLGSRKITNAEFLSVIPGSIGGLTYMNAGAYKKTMEDIIDSVTFIDEKGDIQTIKNKDNKLKFSYRESLFKSNNYIILSVILKLRYACIQDEIPHDKIKRFLKTKKESQPLETANAGSTFKNNQTMLSWQIIDKLGLRGYQIGGAKVNEKHANFLVNASEASFLDMITLLELVKYEAKKQLNIDMECEWEILE